MDKKTTPMSEAANPADGKGPAADLTDRLSASFFGAPQRSSYALFDCVRVSALGGASLSSDTLIESKGLKPIQDSGALEQMVDDLLAKNPLNFLIGQVMKKTRGKADPAALTKLIQKKLRG
jgi:hypothetical protein